MNCTLSDRKRYVLLSLYKLTKYEHVWYANDSYNQIDQTSIIPLSFSFIVFLLPIPILVMNFLFKKVNADCKQTSRERNFYSIFHKLGVMDDKCSNCKKRRGTTLYENDFYKMTIDLSLQRKHELRTNQEYIFEVSQFENSIRYSTKAKVSNVYFSAGAGIGGGGGGGGGGAGTCT